jgi:hypothetical protein
MARFIPIRLEYRQSEQINDVDLCSFGTFLDVLSFCAAGTTTRTTSGGNTMKTIISLLVMSFAVAITAPAFAQDPAPATKADCDKAKGTWDDATGKCTVKK